MPVRREEVRVEREPITDANVDDATDGPAISEEEHEVVLRAEEPVVEKRAVPKERVRLEKETNLTSARWLKRPPRGDRGRRGRYAPPLGVGSNRGPVAVPARRVISKPGPAAAPALRVPGSWPVLEHRPLVDPCSRDPHERVRHEP